MYQSGPFAHVLFTIKTIHIPPHRILFNRQRHWQLTKRTDRETKYLRKEFLCGKTHTHTHMRAFCGRRRRRRQRRRKKWRKTSEEFFVRVKWQRHDDGGRHRNNLRLQNDENDINCILWLFKFMSFGYKQNRSQQQQLQQQPQRQQQQQNRRLSHHDDDDIGISTSHTSHTHLASIVSSQQ